MKQKEIEQKLRNWFKEMLAKYDWLSFKFEFDTKRQVYLVSFYPQSEIDENEEFCRDAMAFEDKVNYLYGQDAPLFCDEETLFSLSENAELISNNTFVYKHENFTFDWGMSMIYFTNNIGNNSTFLQAA